MPQPVTPLTHLLPPADLSRAARLATESGERLDVVATRLGLISEAQLVQAYAAASGATIAHRADFPEVPVL